MASRNRTQQSLTRSDEVEYFLCIEGLAPQCRWQELKDDIRKIPPEGYIRQAHTDNDNGTGWGHITIVNRTKAFDAYDYLLNNGWRGRSVRLTLVVKDEINPHTMKRLRGPEQSMASSSEESPPLQPSYHSHGPSNLSSGPPTSQGTFYNTPDSSTLSNTSLFATGPGYQPVMPHLTQPFMTWPPPFEQSYHPITLVPDFSSQDGTQQPPTQLLGGQTYHHKASSERSRNKAFKKESVSALRPIQPALQLGSLEIKRVYIFNLPSSISEQTVTEHFESAGKIEHVQIKKDRNCAWKFKFTALVTFQTHQQAMNAIRHFAGKTWEGCEIKIKLDQGPRPSLPCAANPPSGHREGPVVVDGSTPSIERHLATRNPNRRDSTSDSD